MAVQVAWMMDVPQLYRLCYDKPPQLQPDAAGYKHSSLNGPSQQHANIYRKLARVNVL